MIVWTVVGLIALGLGYYSMNRGLFVGSVTLICICLATIAGTAFGPAIADAMELIEHWQYGAMLAGIGLVTFVIVRAALGPLDLDVDFHVVLERIGGGITGLSAGLVLGGFLSVCLACARVEQLKASTSDLQDASVLLLGPARTIGSMFPGRHELAFETLVDRYPPPEPDPFLTQDASAEDAHANPDEVPDPGSTPGTIPPDTDENASPRDSAADDDG